jgi:CRISPR-associated protein Csb2
MDDVLPARDRGERRAAESEARFAKNLLWHVEVTFDEPVSGPLALGDGRFMGLGVLAPLARTVGLYVLAIESGLIGEPDPEPIARALRRAVMARVQNVLGDEPLPAFFSGHEPSGGPVRADRSSHLAFAYDWPRWRLLIVAPHVLDHRRPTREEEKHLVVLDRALQGLRELRAGRAGHLVLRPAWLDLDRDPLTGPSRAWESVTSYLVTRHPRMGDAAAALASDLVAECQRRSLPMVMAKAMDQQGVPGVGLCGRLRIQFATLVRGPLLLGRSRHLGGGLFAGTHAT